jgi:hypothetical protein
MSFRTDNAAFEKWLRRRCKVVEADLKYKHKRMRKNAFVFLRATLVLEAEETVPFGDYLIAIGMISGRPRHDIGEDSGSHG